MPIYETGMFWVLIVKTILILMGAVYGFREDIRQDELVKYQQGAANFVE